MLGLARGVDIRTIGSGNIGATNVMRALGAKLGVAALLLDVVKGLGPALVADHIIGLSGWGLYAASISPVFGHCFSPYLGFKGGKGVATALGVALATRWEAGLIAFILAVGITAVTKYMSVGSLISTSTCWLIALPFGVDLPETVTLATVGVLCVARHHSNIQRLLAGTESGMGRKKPDPPEDAPDDTEEDADV